MVFLLARRADLSPDFNPENFESSVSGLPPQFKAMFEATRRVQAEILGIDPKELRPVIRKAPTFGGTESTSNAEILTDGETVYLVELRGRLVPRARKNERGDVVAETATRYWLMVYAIAGAPEVPGFDVLLQFLETRFAVKLAPVVYESERFAELLKEGRSTSKPLDAKQLDSARVLADRLTRTAATAVKTSAGLLVSDLPRQLGDASAKSKDVLDRLLAAGLVKHEFVVICSKTSRQVARFPSLKAIEAVSAQGMTCACGREMKDERCEEAIGITHVGAELLEHSRWFSLLVLDELLKLGIEPDRIILEYQAGGEEMDCIALVGRDLVFFELKDKEFSLRNAYAFGSRISLLRPSRSVIVTSESVGSDVKEHFQRAEAEERRSRSSDYVFFASDEERPTVSVSVQYVEGLDNLSSRLAEIVSGLHRATAARLLQSVEGTFGIASPESLLRGVRRPSIHKKLAPEQSKHIGETVTSGPAPGNGSSARGSSGTRKT